MKVPYLQLALAMCLVGANVAIGKIIVQTVPVFLFSDMRFVIASFILIPLVLLRSETKYVLHAREWTSLFFQSFFGVFLFSIFILYGLRSTSAISAGIITSTTPAFIALIALFLLRERVNFAMTISILLAVVGISLVSIPSFSPAFKMANGGFGNLLVLAAVISEALFTIFAKSLSGKLSPLHMATGVNLIGFLLFLPFSIHDLMTNHLVISVTLWLVIIYYSITASVLSFVLWYQGIAKVPANIAGLFTGFMPVSAAAVGALFLNEQFSIQEMIGMGCAIVAIFVGAWQGNPKKKTTNLYEHTSL